MKDLAKRIAMVESMFVYDMDRFVMNKELGIKRAADHWFGLAARDAAILTALKGLRNT